MMVYRLYVLGTPHRPLNRVLINAVDSMGRRNTTLEPRSSSAKPKPNQDSISAGLTLASDFSLCFQCQRGSSVVLRRPIESTALIGTLPPRGSKAICLVWQIVSGEPCWVVS